MKKIIKKLSEFLRDYVTIDALENSIFHVLMFSCYLLIGSVLLEHTDSIKILIVFYIGIGLISFSSYSFGKNRGKKINESFHQK